MRPHVPFLNYQNYRYQIDIDGNTNAWSGLFRRLLTGCPVLKVTSLAGFEQWYYDRLKPWVNMVPVAADMTDLPEKILWLRANDDCAQKIGEAGRALAEALTDEREIAHAAPVIASAIRAAADGPLIHLRFADEARDDDALRSGWATPDAEGVRTEGIESTLILPRPPGFGDYVMLVELSPSAELPQRVTIVANGEVILRRSITERMTVYCLLPRGVATLRDAIRGRSACDAR
jgi:hypothetical protein